MSAEVRGYNPAPVGKIIDLIFPCFRASGITMNEHHRLLSTFGPKIYYAQLHVSDAMNRHPNPVKAEIQLYVPMLESAYLSFHTL
jgi:hypothetical protein